MKKWTLCLLALLFVSRAVAGVDLLEPLTVSAASTNAAPVAADLSSTTVRNIGHVDAIILDFSGYASPTVDVDVVAVASNALGTTERTLLSIDNVTGDGTYYPRDIADTSAGVDISNEPVCIPLYLDVVQLKVYAANVTNTITVSAYILLK